MARRPSGKGTSNATPEWMLQRWGNAGCSSVRMNRATDTIAVARDMIERHGGAAIALVDQRFRDNLAAGDAEAAVFWSQVAQALRALLDN